MFKKTIYNILGVIYIYITIIIIFSTLSFGNSQDYFKYQIGKMTDSLSSLSTFTDYIPVLISVSVLFFLSFLFNYFLRKIGLINFPKFYLIIGSILAVLTILHLL